MAPWFFIVTNHSTGDGGHYAIIFFETLSWTPVGFVPGCMLLLSAGGRLVRPILFNNFATWVIPIFAMTLALVKMAGRSPGATVTSSWLSVAFNAGATTDVETR
jgi:hypothetical protein